MAFVLAGALLGGAAGFALGALAGSAWRGPPYYMYPSFYGYPYYYPQPFYATYRPLYWYPWYRYW